MSFLLLLLQEGMTALSWASEAGHVNTVRMLEARGAQRKGYGKKLVTKAMLIQVPALVLKCVVFF